MPWPGRSTDWFQKLKGHSVAEKDLLAPIVAGVCAHAQREGGRQVRALHLKVGMDLGLSEGSLRGAFRALSTGTLLEGADLTLTFFPGTRVDVFSFTIHGREDSPQRG